ncbi:hypothetical protein AVEN_103929-1 [Araneus ventricosus]|uniref:Uncharacterized protein n=1 Tax=Araneus ventricosus TaxID=182803 RepID=A0A4Y2WQP3_ARAVE|nr:hypothetical protein AVEN_103929-1 [Araneus ventricosus]
MASFSQFQLHRPEAQIPAHRPQVTGGGPQASRERDPHVQRHEGDGRLRPLPVDPLHPELREQGPQQLLPAGGDHQQLHQARRPLGRLQQRESDSTIFKDSSILLCLRGLKIAALKACSN